MLAYVLGDVHRRPCRQLCLAMVVHLQADVDLPRSRRDRCLRVVVDGLTDCNVTARNNLSYGVLVDGFADGHRAGGLEVHLSPLLDLVRNRDAPVPALESYIAVPANVIDNDVSIESFVDDAALSRIGAKVERREG